MQANIFDSCRQLQRDLVWGSYLLCLRVRATCWTRGHVSYACVTDTAFAWRAAGGSLDIRKAAAQQVATIAQTHPVQLPSLLRHVSADVHIEDRITSHRTSVQQVSSLAFLCCRYDDVSATSTGIRGSRRQSALAAWQLTSNTTAWLR